MHHSMPMILMSAVLAACSNGTPSSSRPEVSLSEQAGHQAGSYTLYRLDGDRYPGQPVPEGSELLHGWTILESCIIDSSRDRAVMFKAFEQGREEMRRIGTDHLPDCFQPRHAIRVVVNDRTTDYLICFQCSNFMVWTDDEQTGGGSTTDSPEKTFDEMLADCGADGHLRSNPN